MNIFWSIFLQLMTTLSLHYGSIVVNGQGYVLTSSCGGVVTDGGSCVLNCQTGSVTEALITWTRGASVNYDVERATCTSAASASTIRDDYLFACHDSNYTLTIGNASVIYDKTTWSCDARFGGQKSNTLNLDVKVPTTTGSPTTTASEPEECDCPIAIVIILIIFLVVKIATDVIFVLYKWGVCLTGISVRMVYILYWSCFAQGICDCVLGVISVSVTSALCTECLDEPLPAGTLALSIIVIVVGAVNILLSLCCYKLPEVKGVSSGPSSKAGGPHPWLCCCCPQTKICSGDESRKSPPEKKPEKERKPDPTSARPLPNTTSGHSSDNAPAPIPAAMASPRKPVPPSSTSPTPRPLPSPTSDPASDSAVKPKVLEPLDVEDQRKKRKKRSKKRKSTKAEESTAQAMNATTEDSDDN